MISGRKVTEGAKVNMEVEHTESDPLSSFNVQQPSVDPGNVAVVDDGV